ncbi:hypothetical protein IFT84_08440 [Rhizobium sp. CFBP 8762]|uniref:hypothetical protein n=1 Tax=Rhizobium sp. CFBP 8762 TaxID=2775279 RepID=UPI001786387E|nr:hypothetical protein [Rhizobium sp. CFBP 8762]MBD8554559.1 hypothetical protein [Rhizobium sp. CFBP 8762]
MTDWRADMGRAITTQRIFGFVGIAFAVVALLLMTVGQHDDRFLLNIALVLAGLTTLGASLHLVLDAALFQLALTRDSEQSGLAAIDHTLADMGLRPLPVKAASLSVRLAGTRRILLRQIAALVILISLTGFHIYSQTGLS